VEWKAEYTCAINKALQRCHEPTPVTERHLAFRAVLRGRQHADGSANFLGPFAHGRRTERFILLNRMAVKDGARFAMPGRIQLHLSRIKWKRVESAVNAGKPIKHPGARQCQRQNGTEAQAFVPRAARSSYRAIRGRSASTPLYCQNDRWPLSALSGANV
jgi:hypothetical protein